MNPSSLAYSHSERLPISQPVDRLDYIVGRCVNRTVLDIGCMDETALVKQGTQAWLHQRIAACANRVIGVDNSLKVPDVGLETGPNSHIVRADALSVSESSLGDPGVEVVVAGEFIEHVEAPLQFLKAMRAAFPGRELIVSTPNGVSAALFVMALLGREVQHPDHLHIYTFKTLHTLFLRAGFESWELIPYRFSATELTLRTMGLRRALVRGGEVGMRMVEQVFPLVSHGYIAVAKL